jgi:predicted DNA-binding transcriptional regulator YafY
VMKPDSCLNVRFSRWACSSGERWLLAAWCERRDDYRCFRLDRCLNIVQTERRFSESADRSLADFLRKVKQ